MHKDQRLNNPYLHQKVSAFPITIDPFYPILQMFEHFIILHSLYLLKENSMTFTCIFLVAITISIPCKICSSHNRKQSPITTKHPYLRHYPISGITLLCFSSTEKVPPNCQIIRYVVPTEYLIIPESIRKFCL